MILPSSYLNADGPSIDYPFGKFVDESAPAAGDGTPVLDTIGMDALQPWLLLMDIHSITPTDNPEIAGASDGIDALKAEILATQIFTGPITINDVTDSSTSDNGSVVLKGGMGINKSLHVGLFLRVFSTVDSTAPGNGGALFFGGVGIAKDLSVGGVIKTFSTGDSSGPTNGAMQSAGGLGVVKTINGGNEINALGGFGPAVTIAAATSTRNDLWDALAPILPVIGDKCIMSGGAENTAAQSLIFSYAEKIDALTITIYFYNVTTGTRQDFDAINGSPTQLTDEIQVSCLVMV